MPIDIEPGDTFFIEGEPATEAGLVELVSAVTLVGSADLGWGDVDTYRVGSTTVTESQFLAEINFGDTLAIGEEGGERIATLNNHSSRGLIGDESNIGAPDPGVEIAVQVDYGEFVGGNDLAGGDSFVLSQAGYDAGEQEFRVDGTAYDYTGIEDFLVDGTGGSTIGELVDGGLSLHYRRDGGVEHFELWTSAP